MYRVIIYEVTPLVRCASTWCSPTTKQCCVYVSLCSQYLKYIIVSIYIIHRPSEVHSFYCIRMMFEDGWDGVVYRYGAVSGSLAGEPTGYFRQMISWVLYGTRYSSANVLRTSGTPCWHYLILKPLGCSYYSSMMLMMPCRVCACTWLGLFPVCDMPGVESYGLRPSARLWSL